MASEDTKQIKVVGFYLTVVTLALLFAAYKGCEKGCADGCEVGNCRDEFIPESVTTAQCSPGASAEVVTEPKRGILCRCKRDPAMHKP